jgi:hypothetical protein
MRDDERLLTFALMDTLFGSLRCRVVLKLAELALQRGFDVAVFTCHDGVRAPAGAARLPGALPDGRAPVLQIFDSLQEVACRHGRALHWYACGDAAVTDPGTEFVRLSRRSVNTLVVPAT